jgi:hypothetical protein
MAKILFSPYRGGEFIINNTIIYEFGITLRMFSVYTFTRMVGIFLSPPLPSSAASPLFPHTTLRGGGQGVYVRERGGGVKRWRTFGKARKSRGDFK